MSACEQELCRNWTGQGCVCAVFGIEPDVVCGHCQGFDCEMCHREER